MTQIDSLLAVPCCLRSKLGGIRRKQSHSGHVPFWRKKPRYAKEDDGLDPSPSPVTAGKKGPHRLRRALSRLTIPACLAPMRTVRQSLSIHSNRVFLTKVVKHNNKQHTTICDKPEISDHQEMDGKVCPRLRGSRILTSSGRGGHISRNPELGAKNVGLLLLMIIPYINKT